jgi:hypothetical protein
MLSEARLLAIRWSAYGLAFAIAAIYLFVPGLALYAQVGDTARASQQVVFYLWKLEAFALLLLAGIVRESGVIPSFGDAYLDLLGAFVPFTLAALVLTLAAWSRCRRARSPGSCSGARLCREENAFRHF